MWKRIALFTCFSLVISSVLHGQRALEPVHVIFDPDKGPDYDDVGAMAMLHVFLGKGKAEILATIASTKVEKAMQRLLINVSHWLLEKTVPMELKAERT